MSRSSLHLAPREHFGPTPSTFLDLIVDDRSLLTRLGDHDLISVLNDQAGPSEAHVVDRLIVPAPPEADDRIAPSVCPECRDPACGANTGNST